MFDNIKHFSQTKFEATKSPSCVYSSDFRHEVAATAVGGRKLSYQF
jgi:hypothetical protein